MSQASRLDAMGFEEFKKSRQALAPNLAWDMAEHNLYASLPRAFAGEFGAIAPSGEQKAAYRCHVAELFLERFGVEATEKNKASCAVSEGVRAALGAVMGMLARAGSRVLLPQDVYPQYQAIAVRAGVDFSTYCARGGPPTDQDLEGVDAVVICDPLKPWGGELDESQRARLGAWATRRPGQRLLIVDCAYDIDKAPRWRGAPEALVLTSLSKGWLSPLRGGCAWAPPAWESRCREAIGTLPKNENNLRVAYAALARFPNRPAQVARALVELSSIALERLRAIDPEAAAKLKFSGYFARSDLSAAQWRERGVLAIPASVFGSSLGGSVLSSLAPI